MPDYTKNYNFIKPKKTENYDIDDVTRKNMDITDTELFNKQNKEPGKGLSTNDFTNAYKTKLDSLKNYDDTELKKQIDKNTKSIQDIEKEQLVQNSSISSLNYYVEQNSEEIYENANNIIALQKENTALKEELERQKEDNKLNGLTEDNEGELLHITNTTGARFNSLEIFGNEKQDYYLPDEYTQLEYLESSGTQYIDTGYKANQKTEYEVKFSYSKMIDSSNGFVLGARISSTEENLSMTCDSGTIFVGRGNNYASINSSTIVNQKYKIKVTENSIVKDGITINNTANDFEGTGTYNVRLFGCINNGVAYRTFSGKIYYCKIWDNGELVREFIPCRRNSDSVLGMYDRVNNVFYTNAGSGVFTAGSEQKTSLDYPAKIKTVGNNINEFDKDNANTLTAYLDINNYKISTNSTTKTLYIPCKANTTYTVSKISSKRFGIAFTNDTPAVDSKINNAIENLNGVTSLTQKSTSQSKYLCVYYYKSDVDTLTEQEILNSIKVEEGRETTGYSPYNQGSIKLNIIKDNIYNVKDVKGTLGNVVVDEDDFITMSYNNSQGASTHYVNYFTNKNNYLKPDTKYYGVLEIKSVTGKGSIFVSGQSARDAQTDAWLEFNLQNLSNNSKKLFEFTTLKEEEFYNCKIMFRTYLMTSVGQSAKVSFRISVFEEQQNLDTFTYEKYKIQSIVMPTQQKMLEGDYIKDVEHHTWNECILTGEEEYVKGTTKEKTQVFQCTNIWFGNPKEAICNYCGFNTDGDVEKIAFETDYLYIAINKNRLTENTVEAFKTYLTNLKNSGNPFRLFYKRETALDLELTEEQKIASEQIKQAHTYKEVTNVYTEDEVGAIIKTNTNVDLKSLINNIQEQLIAE